MRLKARKFTSIMINSSKDLWRKVYIKAPDGSRRKSNRSCDKISRQKPDKPEDFLYSALSDHRRNETERAICTLEAGLQRYPDAERLLENYLRICCQQEMFTRIVHFISPANTQLFQTLLGLHIFNLDPDRQLIDDGEEHCLTWLTEEIINKDFDDVVTLWLLADLLEYAGKENTVKKIYRRLSARETNNPDDYLYSCLSHVRLGNIELGFKKLGLGLTMHPNTESIRSVFKWCCYSRFAFDHYLPFKDILGDEEVSKSRSALNFYRHAFKENQPETFLLKLKDAGLNCDDDDFNVLKEDFLSHLRKSELTIEKAKLLVFFSKYLDLDADFSERILLVLNSLNWGDDDKAAKYCFMLIYKLTLPIVPYHASKTEEIVKKFTIDAQTISHQSVRITEPLSDLGKNCAPWQSLFCLVQPKLYRHAMSAFEALAFSLWPRLDYTAPHICRPIASEEMLSRKIRIGFTVLDSMPMMSGFMERLDKDIFETVFLRPGKGGESKTAKDWVSRADTMVEYSDTNAYSAIDTISNQELDILISGPSVPQILFPLMARLAHLHMVLLEPNWPDGIKNSDYYISWQMAEPENYKDFYKTSVSLLQSPPYWIERPSLGGISAISEETRNEIRQRLLGLGPRDRFYICANTNPKIHPEMDDILYKLLEMDSTATLVLLRGEHATAQPLKVRLKEKFGRNYERVTFLDTLERDDAHSLLLSADCCLDSYPICGMSSSFDGVMLGVPIVTLPADIPFGRWTTAIYKYIGVADLTAGDIDEYIRIAMRVANDKDWRLKKSAEMREKSSRYVESKASFEEFQHFIVQAWRRKQAGLPPENWVAGKWQA